MLPCACQYMCARAYSYAHIRLCVHLFYCSLHIVQNERTSCRKEHAWICNSALAKRGKLCVPKWRYGQVAKDVKVKRGNLP
ncbi:hypothetical protein POVWA2_001120 [Plasmodium ovale wallikeri]|uniref:Uncharacterized protein n=1 Tax=Plasmodium ovale wallikeri TaxID=864142 RepID=A0A1A8YFW8_PLAOA|nr:hypothetical protein POVWA1_000850 [Plasmodium ovale wallikeri]SBT30871.1 hypothetical protein POVWA2_001120 [Plasmodium ovale wallikeri]